MYIVVWGANVLSTNVHLWPFIVEARRRGARLVVIDPVVTKVAGLADWHLRPYPGSDLALALGLMHVIFRDGLERCDGDTAIFQVGTTDYDAVGQNRPIELQTAGRDPNQLWSAAQ